MGLSKIFLNIVQEQLTHCQVPSAVTFANSLDPDQAQQKVGPDLDPNNFAR